MIAAAAVAVVIVISQRLVDCLEAALTSVDDGLINALAGFHLEK